MMELISPLVAKHLETVEKHLEVVLLLACDNVDEGIERPVLMAADRSAEVLCDVDGSAVLSQKDLLVQSDIGKL